MTMENDNSRSSSEDSTEDISNNETAQKMDLDEMSCSNSDEGKSLIGLADKNRKTSPSGFSRMADHLKSSVQRPKDDAAGDVPSENLRHPNQDSPLSADEHRTDEKTEKFERNLKKFLKEREPLREVQLRKKTKISRQVRSDGEMAKIIEYCGDALKLSSTLSNTNRTSAPPTFNNEMEPKQISQTDKAFCVEYSKNVVSKEIAQNSNIVKKDAVGAENSSPARALDLRLSKLSAFKVPISPDQKTTPGKSVKMVLTESKEDVVTPVQRRPTHFDIKPRKAFYTFSPGCSSGVLRQCQSLPDINRPRRKDEAQRRSINFGEHSRIVRSLFRDKPVPATPESRVSTVNKSYKSLQAPESTENAPEEKAPKTLQNRTSKICRKLVFGSSSKELADRRQVFEVDKASCDPHVRKSTSPENSSKKEVPKTLQNHPSKTFRKLDFSSSSKETADKSHNIVVKKVCSTAAVPKSNSPEDAPQVGVPKSLQSLSSKTCRKPVLGSSLKETTDKSQQAGLSCDPESPSKRKNASPIICSISSKKVRISSRTKVEESGNGENVKKNVSLVDVECSISAEKVKTSSGTKLKEGESSKNIMLVDVGCSISDKVRTSPGTKMEESGENVRKNEIPIDVECSISAKKVKTT